MEAFLKLASVYGPLGLTSLALGWWIVNLSKTHRDERDEWRSQSIAQLEASEKRNKELLLSLAAQSREQIGASNLRNREYLEVANIRSRESLDLLIGVVKESTAMGESLKATLESLQRDFYWELPRKKRMNEKIQVGES